MLELIKVLRAIARQQTHRGLPSPAVQPTVRLQTRRSLGRRNWRQANDEKEALKTQLQAASAQLEELKNQNLRLAADFENFRRRTQKEKEELDLQARCLTIKPLLPVIDNFERARSHVKPQTDGEMNIHKSYQSVYKQMVDRPQANRGFSDAPRRRTV